MGCIKKNVLQNGDISYRIQVKAKNLRTGKFEAKVMTWRKPAELTERQCEKELKRLEIEFEDKFRKQLNGDIMVDDSITFMEYAYKWLETIKMTRSVNYFIKGRDALRKFEEYFGNIKLADIRPITVQGYLDKLCSHKVQMERAFLIKDLQLFVRSHSVDLCKRLRENDFSRSTYFSAVSGHGILVSNAQKLCEILNLKFDDYFKIQIDSHPYAKETILKLKRTLATILASAKRQGLIEHNFASQEYIAPIQGYKKEIKILNDKEAIELERYLREEEINPRWRIAILTILYMGLRRGELGGLEWKDIDFENGTMRICRSVQELPGFGIFTKEPKTETSKRTISMPENLISYLKEYQVWWQEHKSYLGDRWETIDRLFSTDSGEPISPGLYIVWLHKILNKAGLPKVTLHSLRHTNITLQLNAGVDMKTVSTRAGHARASTTSDFYSHFLQNSDIHASQKINNIFG